MRLIIDARALRVYPVGKPGFSGATENIVRELAGRLAHPHYGHTVHVVTPDLEREEQRGVTEWWWGPNNHPTSADVLILVHNLEGLARTEWDVEYHVLMANAINPWLGDTPEIARAMAQNMDAFSVISEAHAQLLQAYSPVPGDRIVVTGVGVDAGLYDLNGYASSRLSANKIYGRLLWASDPQRGLWHMLDIFDHLRKLIPVATLHVAYDFERQFEHHRWASSSLAQTFWDCKRRLETTPGITMLPALEPQEMIQQQLECHVFAYPCDPLTPGSELFCLSAMEAAAAGSPLVLSDGEMVFPQLYGEAADILPVPGTFLPQHGRRYDAQDWAEHIADLIRDHDRWAEQSRKARALAEEHSWDRVTENWDRMLTTLGIRQLRAA